MPGTAATYDFIECPGMKTLAVLVVVPVGSRDEKDKADFGVCHMLEHLLLLGSKRYPTPTDVTNAVASIGARLNAFTTAEATGYHLELLGGTLTDDRHRPAAQILSDVVLRPRLLEKRLDSEKPVVIEELRRSRDHPEARVIELLYEQVFAGTDLGHDVGGSPEIVAKYTHEQVKRWHKRYLDGGMHVVAAGHLSKKDRQQLKDWFADEGFQFRRGAQPSIGLRARPLPAPRAAAKAKHTTKPVADREQVQLAYAYRCSTAAGDVAGRCWRELLAHILGGGFDSRLFHSLRGEPRGIVYSVHASLDWYEDCGVLVIACGVEQTNLAEAKRRIASVLDAVRASAGPGKRLYAAEAERALTTLYGNELMHQDDVLEVARHRARARVHQLPAQDADAYAKQFKQMLGQLRAGADRFMRTLQSHATDLLAPGKQHLMQLGGDEPRRRSRR